MKKCKLVTPSDKAIIGIQGKDGEIIQCTHIKWATDGLGGQTVVYLVPDVSKIPENKILVDEDGVKWAEIDIWHVSIK